MAIAENGPFGVHRGKLENTVYYILNGQQIARKIGRTTKPPTSGKLQHWAKVKLVNTFLSTIKDFLRTGFGPESLGTTKNAFNMAVGMNFRSLVKGTYPGLEIDYPQLIVSKGKLKPAQNPSVAVEDAGLRFSWDTDPRMSFAEASEQAMLLAYFPEHGKSVSKPFGAARQLGTDLLALPEALCTAYMEVYISFIAADRTQVSDSLYLGSVNQNG